MHRKLTERAEVACPNRPLFGPNCKTIYFQMTNSRPSIFIVLMRVLIIADMFQRGQATVDRLNALHEVQTVE